jgi:hypothetical protein
LSVAPIIFPNFHNHVEQIERPARGFALLLFSKQLNIMLLMTKIVVIAVSLVLLALMIWVLKTDTASRPPTKADPSVPVQTHW